MCEKVSFFSFFFKNDKKTLLPDPAALSFFPTKTKTRQKRPRTNKKKLTGVGPGRLRDARKVLEQVRRLARRRVALAMRPVVHQVRRHHNLPLHHVRERAHRPGGIELEQLVHDLLVGALVAGLVPGDGRADLAEDLVAVLGGVERGVAVRDLGGALLEGTVGEIFC